MLWGIVVRSARTDPGCGVFSTGRRDDVSFRAWRKEQKGEEEVRVEHSSCLEAVSVGDEKVDGKEEADMRWDGEKLRSVFERGSSEEMEARRRGGGGKKRGLCCTLDWGGTGTRLRTDTIIVIQPALEPSQRGDAQLEALEEMKGRGVRRSTKLQCCLEHEKGGER